MRFWNKVLVLATLASLATLAAAQDDTPPKVTLTLGSPTAMANKAIHATLTVTFSEGLHGYQNPPSDPSLIPVTVKSADNVFKVVMVQYPKGTPTKVDGEPKPINVYQGTIKIPVVIQAPSKLGKATVSLSFKYQQCNQQSCFAPGTIVAKATVNIVKYSGPAKQMSMPMGKA